MVHPACGVLACGAPRWAAPVAEVLREAPVDPGGRDYHHRQARHDPHDRGNRTAEAVAGEHDLAVPLAGDLGDPAEQVLVAPVVARHPQRAQEVVDPDDDHFHSAPRPHPHRREERRKDAEGDGLRPHPDVLYEVAHPYGVGPADRDHQHRLLHAMALELHLDPADAAHLLCGLGGGVVSVPLQAGPRWEGAVQEVLEAGVGYIEVGGERQERVV
mmetsp:Transcript_17962/g.50899  ORF Transcript_17962/g.50899 Transcript_17962/m.50899 type:complete len:215 (-) Transcript_17962:885-1529(-)